MSLKAQVVIGEGVTIKKNTTLIVQDQDIIVEGDIAGEGKIIQQEIQSKNLKVVYKGKELKGEKLAQLSIEQEKIEEAKVYVAENEEEVAPTMVLIPIDLVKEPLKMGSLTLTMIEKEYHSQLPLPNAFVSNGYLMPIDQIDNYFILNDNYKIITKESIMSSINMHESLFVNRILDPPKA